LLYWVSFFKMQGSLVCLSTTLVVEQFFDFEVKSLTLWYLLPTSKVSSLSIPFLYTESAQPILFFF